MMSRPWSRQARMGYGILLSLTATALPGCQGERSVLADSLETPLTQGDGERVGGCYSPDGHWIAYSDMTVPEHSSVHIMPAGGGDARRLTSDDSFATAMGWSPDSKSILVNLPIETRVQRIDLEGNVMEDMPAPAISKFEGISSDGSRYLWCRLNGDNYDIGLIESNRDTAWHPLEETPVWEVGGCFGPGADEVTIARQPTINASSSELGVYSLTTGSWTPLPLPKARNHEPAWSPNGDYLCFVSDRAGSLDLWVYDARNTRVVQLTSGPEDELHPEWSPDGDRILFSRVAVNSHVFVGDPVSMTRRQRTHGPARDYYPRESPQGTWVAFFRKHPPSGQSPAAVSFCLAPIEGGDVTVLDLGTLVPTQGDWMFCWSPDGEQLAFSADDGTGNVDIYRIVRESGRPERVTIAPGMDAVPAWSPDGRTLAYTRLAGGETQIWTVPANGGLSVQITDHAGLNQAPLWAPDSRRFAYLSSGTEGTSEIRVIAADGTGDSQLLLSTKELILPYAWSADGGTVLCFRLNSEAWGVDGIRVADQTRFAVADGLEKDERFFARFRPGFEGFRDRIYPGGVNVFTDGPRTAQLVAIEAARVLSQEHRAARD